MGPLPSLTLILVFVVLLVRILDLVFFFLLPLLLLSFSLLRLVLVLVLIRHILIAGDPGAVVLDPKSEGREISRLQRRVVVALLVRPPCEHTALPPFQGVKIQLLRAAQLRISLGNLTQRMCGRRLHVSLRSRCCHGNPDGHKIGARSFGFGTGRPARCRRCRTTVRVAGRPSGGRV